MTGQGGSSRPRKLLRAVRRRRRRRKRSATRRPSIFLGVAALVMLGQSIALIVWTVIRLGHLPPGCDGAGTQFCDLTGSSLLREAPVAFAVAGFGCALAYHVARRSNLAWVLAVGSEITLGLAATAREIWGIDASGGYVILSVFAALGLLLAEPLKALVNHFLDHR
ncbi:MAG TPA: hypothetical protein VIP77_00330 [Jiangellaceae bacterium]